MPRAKQFDEEEVLQKAMILFWKKGYHDTSITDLIKFLGISNASIYHTFGGKKELFDRAFEYYRTINFTGLSHFLSTQEDIRIGLKMAFQKIIDDDATDEDCKGCFVVNTSTELLPSDKDDKLQGIITQYQDKMVTTFFTFLEKGVQKGQISPQKDLKMIARLLYTLMMGLRVVAKTKPDPLESQASVDAVLSLLD